MFTMSIMGFWSKYFGRKNKIECSSADDIREAILLSKKLPNGKIDYRPYDHITRIEGYSSKKKKKSKSKSKKNNITLSNLECKQKKSNLSIFFKIRSNKISNEIDNE